MKAGGRVCMCIYVCVGVGGSEVVRHCLVLFLERTLISWQVLSLSLSPSLPLYHHFCNCFGRHNIIIIQLSPICLCVSFCCPSFDSWTPFELVVVDNWTPAVVI